MQKNKEIMSPVFGRDSGYVFKIFSNEEERMHIHVLGDGHEANFGWNQKLNWQRTAAFQNMN